MAYQQENLGSNDPIVDEWSRYQQGVSSGPDTSGMQLYIGSDHAGFELKEVLLRHLKDAGYTVVDKGTNGPDSVDYPDHAHAVAEKVASDPNALGIVVCGSGNGVNITANKHAGVRSALAWNKEVAALARQHNNANVLALPARFIEVEEAIAIVDAYLSASFEGGRHQNRVAKIETNC